MHYSLKSRKAKREFLEKDLHVKGERKIYINMDHNGERKKEKEKERREKKKTECIPGTYNGKV